MANNHNSVQKQKQNQMNARKSYQPETKTSKVIRGLTTAAGAVYSAAKVAKGAYDLYKIIRNHPTWYTHYSSSNLVALNLSTKQNDQFSASSAGYVNADEVRNSKMGMPAVASITVQLTTPKGDLFGWQTGIRLLYQQLRTANSGRVNYTVQDVEKYVVNVRALHAISATLSRTYCATYTFRSTNNQIPYNILIAEGMNPQSMLENAADLYMYTQRYIEQIKVCFPLCINLFDRAEWLFGNVFADSDSEKPSFYVPALPQAEASATSDIEGGIIFYHHLYDSNDPALNTDPWQIEHGWMNNSNDGLFTYQQLIDNAGQIKDLLIADGLMATIAGDIIKAYGNSAFYNFYTPAIDEPVTILYDEDALQQFKNANVVGAYNWDATNEVGLQNASFTTASIGKSNGTFYQEYGNIQSNTHQYSDSDQWINPALQINITGSTVASTSNVNPLLLEKINQYLLDWHDNSIDPGRVMSITRFIASNAEAYNSATNSIIEYYLFGTEVITGVKAIYQYNTKESSTVFLSGPFRWLPIAGYICFNYDNNTTTTERSIALLDYTNWVFFLWANYDWCPRPTLIVGSTTSEGARVVYIGAQPIDWDVFATVRPETLATYFSYGNQSLLYSGPSQNQSNRSVYGKQSKSKGSDKIPSKSKSAKSETLEKDKD